VNKLIHFIPFSFLNKLKASVIAAKTLLLI
jgi:hypothetical protein